MRRNVTVSTLQNVLVPVLKECGVSKAVLFGSYAHGYAGERSETHPVRDASLGRRKRQKFLASRRDATLKTERRIPTGCEGRGGVFLPRETSLAGCRGVERESNPVGFERVGKETRLNGVSRRDNTLLTVGFNLRERGTYHQVPQGRHLTTNPRRNTATPFQKGAKVLSLRDRTHDSRRGCCNGTPEALNVNNRRWSVSGTGGECPPLSSAPQGLNTGVRTSLSASLPQPCGQGCPHSRDCSAPAGADVWGDRCPPVPCGYALHRRLFTLRTSGAGGRMQYAPTKRLFTLNASGVKEVLNG